jgi:hypothetical protein
VFRAIRVVSVRSVPGVLFAYVVLVFVQFCIFGPQLALNAAMVWFSQNPSQSGSGAEAVAVLGAGVGSMILALIGIVVNIVVAVLTVGLSRALRKVAVEGSGAAGGPIRVLMLSGSTFFYGLAMVSIVGLIVLVGLCLAVVPGFVAIFFLFSATYLVVAADVPFDQAFQRSTKISLANGPIVLAWIGCSLVYGVTMIVVNVALSIGSALALGPWGSSLVAPLVQWLIGVTLGYPLLLISNGILVAIETADSGTAIVD